MFLETVLVKNGYAPFLHLHNRRMNLTRKKFSLGLNPLEIKLPNIPDNNTYRLRIKYEKSIESIELISYCQNKKSRVVAVNSDISYSYKYVNRDVFDGLLAKYSEYDDLLIVKKGVVTDTTIANVAFFNGKKWLTPSNPLLKGTTRSRLIASGFLIPKRIKIGEIYSYSHIGFLNALTGFYIAGETNKIIDFSK